MSKHLLIRLESSDRQYPPITLDMAIPEDLARIIQATPITSTTLSVSDSIFVSPAAELMGEFNRFIIE